MIAMKENELLGDVSHMRNSLENAFDKVRISHDIYKPTLFVWETRHSVLFRSKDSGTIWGLRMSFSGQKKRAFQKLEMSFRCC
jgi:hypothetical protein